MPQLNLCLIYVFGIVFGVFGWFERIFDLFFLLMIVCLHARPAACLSNFWLYISLSVYPSFVGLIGWPGSDCICFHLFSACTRASHFNLRQTFVLQIRLYYSLDIWAACIIASSWLINCCSTLAVRHSTKHLWKKNKDYWEIMPKKEAQPKQLQ